MNVELFSYSGLATILGMVVVFLFLGFLCLLMASLKAVFNAGASPSAPTDRSPGDRSADPARSGSLASPDWLWVAVSAYLALEGQAPCSAGPWQAREADQPDPWRWNARMLGRGI